MAKTYAESVKLPNLVAVPHPSMRLARNGLNVEGINSVRSKSNTSSQFTTKSLDRKTFITSLLGRLTLIFDNL